ncbi:hypothetical protein PMAYCL1PPCAC_06328, partial [Pristionchus mayeri]
VAFGRSRLAPMPNDNEDPSSYRVLPCCGLHVKQIIPIFAALRLLISTFLCLALLYLEQSDPENSISYHRYHIIILWQCAIAATFVYGVYEEKKLTLFTYAYLEVTAIIFHTFTYIVSIIQGFSGSSDMGGIICVWVIIALTLVFCIFYFWRVVGLYIRYLSNVHFFENPPVIFVDKDELIPMNNTIKSRAQ